MIRHSSILEIGEIGVLTLSTDEGQDETNRGDWCLDPINRRRPRRNQSCNSEKIIRHSSILEVEKIDVLTLSTDEGQNETDPAILKR
ncbi:hypothetical protein GQ457_18G013160 [Hibiscus cannabinus]